MRTPRTPCFASFRRRSRGYGRHWKPRGILALGRQWKEDTGALVVVGHRIRWLPLRNRCGKVVGWGSQSREDLPMHGASGTSGDVFHC